MTTTDLPGSSRPTVRATLLRTPEPVDAGEVVDLHLRVTNTSTVIQSYRIGLVGVDPARLASPDDVELFPEQDVELHLQLLVPADHAAGVHQVGVRVATSDGDGVVVETSYEVAAVHGLVITTEPATLEAGSTGSFLVHLHNHGNTVLRPSLVGLDPERLVDVAFEPERPEVAGGERDILRASATGPRPWFGMPVVRVLELTATDGETEATTSFALVQRPRLSRRLVAFLGLLAMITLFALVIMLSFDRVADLSERNEELLSQQLELDADGAARATPGQLVGVITTSSGGPADSAEVELFERDNPIQPFATTVTGPDGSYTFSTVPPGEYLIRSEAAGSDPRWYPGELDIADATVVTVVDGQANEPLPAAVLPGRPGGVSGVVIGADVEGAVLRVQIPGSSIAGSSLADNPPAVVDERPLDVTGRFELTGLATPQLYELVVSKPGFAPVRRDVNLSAGETRGDVELILARGAGVIVGEVVDRTGEPLGGVAVAVSDGITETTTRTLSNDEAPGTFEVRDLDTAATYTLTFTRDGYVTETRGVTTTQDGPVELTVPLTSSTASIAGTVRTPDGDPVPSAAVEVSGPDVERETRTLSVGGPGTFLVADLPQPAAYTVTVSAEGYVTTAISVDLPAPGGGDRDTLAITLVPSLGSISGAVADETGERLPGALVTVEGTGVERTTRTADDPAGAYQLDRLPAGVYTITVERPGSSPQTLQVTVAPGSAQRVPTFVLETQAVVSGTVTRDGIPVLDIEVVVHRSEEYPSNPLLLTLTDADGRFQLIGLDAPQRYVIDIRTPAGEVLRSERVDLAPGEQVDDLRIAL